MQIEKVILKNLLLSEQFGSRVLPFIKPEYFDSSEDKATFECIKDFIHKYDKAPNMDALSVEIHSRTDISDEAVKNVDKTIDAFKSEKVESDIDWLVESTEKFCQERAVHIAVMQSIDIIGGKSKLAKGAIPTLLSEAISISFDPHIGHDYFEDSKQRYEYYHRQEEKVPFDLHFLNKITKGGVAKKTLNMIMGGVHAGKSLTLCHLAAAYLAQGKNVLYITLEMAEEEITRRIDTNLLNVSFDDLEKLPFDLFQKRVDALKSKTAGKLIVKEYPSTSASVDHFRALLTELKLKKKFIPDVIMIDYLNICASSRIKSSSAGDMYSYVKSIAEEVRGFAQLMSIPIWSATQLNRAGFGSSDPEMTDVAESFGINATVDLLLVLVSSEALRKANQIMFKQLKNRYGDMELNKKFTIGVDKTKMKLYDVEESAQVDIDDSGQEVPQQNKFDRKDKFRRLVV